MVKATGGGRDGNTVGYAPEMRSHLVTGILLAAACAVAAPRPYKPSREELAKAYARANNFQTLAAGAVLNQTLTPHWVAKGLWYDAARPGGSHEYVLADGHTGAKSDLFSTQMLAGALSRATGGSVEPAKMTLTGLAMSDDLASATFTYSGKAFRYDIGADRVTAVDRLPTDETGAGRRGRGRRGPVTDQQLRDTPPTPSPDRHSEARIQDGQVQVRPDGGEWKTVSSAGAFTTFHWAGDSAHLLAFRLIPGDHKKLYLLHATGPDKTRATLEERQYDQPGDKLDTFEPYILAVDGSAEKKVALDPIMGGAYPWPGAPGAQWWNGRFLLDFPIRGYQEMKVVAIGADDAAQVLVDEKSPTFVDISRTINRPLQRTPEMLFRSERDGWARLYLIDGNSGEVKNAVTPTGGVFREIVRIDEDRRQLVFTESGLHPGQDPYYIHYYRVNFDGSGLTELTQGDGTHTVAFSPDNSLYVDTYSRVDMAPVHELRRASDGSLVATLEKADISRLLKNGVRLPERFIAKGRDGLTDIYGIVVTPTNFDPHRSYPVIENIYAGPQDSFVPKAFAPFLNMSRLAELGFIVVQIDGMGTANRGKKFHDVCWHNIADAGFPDRILWMKALAKNMPQADISRVGVYGTSAGGQNACGALLWHPEFYKVGVASCGCHDNAIDKQWWNEQWMGYPVGPWYAEDSNANNVNKLKGHLFLFVAEDDHNVPPESTIRLLAAFETAQKDVDFLMFPAADHTDGGPYGEHKRRDYFVHWLLGADPPDWNNK